MKTIIIKLNATGDVVRTTTLLRALTGNITWVTAPNNLSLFEGSRPDITCLCWDSPEMWALKGAQFDLVINLEDEPAQAQFIKTLSCDRLFGAYLDDEGKMTYTKDARGWFDMSLISRFGREQADQLKLTNRRTYQELIFEGLGLYFDGQEYVLPEPAATDLHGDVAIAPVAGPVWPMKNWAYYDQLQGKLREKGIAVNVLPRRASLREHLGDIKNHRCLVGGDSLPMHLALGLRIPCVTIFNCTSPWEIHGYGLQTQLVSPLLNQFFYKRTFDQRATTAISLDDVLNAVMAKL